MDKISNEYISVTNAKEFILFMVREIVDEKELEDVVLKEFEDIFSTLIDGIYKLSIDDEIKTYQFKYGNSVLSYTDNSLEHKELFKTLIKETDKFEDRQKHFFNMMKFLAGGLRTIRFNRGANFIASILSNFKYVDGFNPQIEVELSLHTNELYAEKLHILLIRMYEYCSSLDGVDGFCVREWDRKRAEIDAIFHRANVKDSKDNMDYLNKYFESLITAMERNCAELEYMVSKLKFN